MSERASDDSHPDRKRVAATCGPAPAGVLRHVVGDAAQSIPLRQWLAARFTYLSEADWQAQILAGRVWHNGERGAPDADLHRGDVIDYAPDAAESSSPDVAIVHDDAAFVVVDKPPHLVCHRTSAFPANTFLPAFEHRLACRLEPAHRLDRETSGLLVLAKDPGTFAALQAQFAAGAVDKRYLALCHGSPPSDEFAIDAPIGRAAGSAIRERRAVTPAGKPARTECTVVRRFAAHALLAVTPRTGRTHQIRVHLAHRGLPLVGDKLYGRTDAQYLAWTAHLKSGGDPRDRPRTMLHASELAFAHPRTGERVACRSGLPADMAAPA